jgi:hypothetical protein
VFPSLVNFFLDRTLDANLKREPPILFPPNTPGYLLPQDIRCPAYSP